MAPTASVCASMYTEPETSPGTDETATALCTCPNCGKAIAKPRRNQTYCSAKCRGEATERKRHRNTEPKMDTCPHCGSRFEKVKKTKRFCSTECQQAFNNHWKSHGPALALAMYDWRVGKKPKGMTRVCQEFSRAREDLQEKRTKAHAAKGRELAKSAPGGRRKGNTTSTTRGK